MEKIPLTNGWIAYAADFLTQEEAWKLYEHFEATLDWESGEIQLFGKKHPIPRLEAYYAEDGRSYGYSGKKLTIRPFTPALLEIKQKIEAWSGERFNAVLANYYRNGQDSNGWHADNEPELGENPVIASISLGAVRRFDLRNNETREQKQLLLEHGSLLLMGGALQHYWKHQVAKTKRVDTGRINLTFRWVN